VNIEVDILGKYVEKLLGLRREPETGPARSRLDLEFLAEHGYK
jgi:hypothetical protein